MVQVQILMDLQENNWGISVCDVCLFGQLYRWTLSLFVGLSYGYHMGNKIKLSWLTGYYHFKWRLYVRIL